MEDRLILPGSMGDEEDKIEKSLRPQLLSQYIGQEKVKQQLDIYIQAAKNRKEALDHVLLHGPPGLGKTTLAYVIANELDVNIRTSSGPAIEKTGDLLAMLNELEPGDVLFIDEIHRMSRSIEEMLYSAMEDYFVDIFIGEGQDARPVHFPLPPFTLIGATTRAGILSAPLRNRFGIVMHMQYYSVEELTDLAMRTGDILQADLKEDGAYEIARSSRGTPRIANRLLKRVRDIAEVQSDGVIDQVMARQALSLLEVDQHGLDATDKALLSLIIDKYGGGPVGLSTLAANIGEEVDTVEEMIEPYLLQIGALQRTARGRMITETGYSYLGRSPDGKEE